MIFVEHEQNVGFCCWLVQKQDEILEQSEDAAGLTNGASQSARRKPPRTRSSAVVGALIQGPSWGYLFPTFGFKTL
jgi:hypothetical protein